MALGVYGVDGDALGDAVGPALGLRLVSWSTVEGALGDAGVYGDALGDADGDVVTQLLKSRFRSNTPVVFPSCFDVTTLS